MFLFVVFCLLISQTENKTDNTTETTNLKSGSPIKTKHNSIIESSEINSSPKRQNIIVSNQAKQKKSTKKTYDKSLNLIEKCKVLQSKICRLNKEIIPLYIEKIIVVSTDGKNFNFIKNFIPIKRGTYLKPNSKLLEITRLKLKSTGFFKKVELSFKKTNIRSKVLLYITVTPKNTVIINNIFMGSSKIVPFWFGLGITDKSFLNTGIKLGIEAVGSTKARILNGIYQYGFNIFALFPNVYDYPIYTDLKFVNSSLFYRLYGEGEDASPHNFLSLKYRNLSTHLETFFPIKNFYLHLLVNHNFIYSDLPNETVRHYPDGTSKRVNFGLKDGFSVIGSFKAVFIYDTRDLPVLPSNGSFVSFSGEMSNAVTGSAYSFGKFDFLGEKYIKYKKQIWSFHIFAGTVTGEIPILKKYYIGDIQNLVAPRALGMNLSVAPSPNFLNTNISEFRWGRIAFKTWIRFDYPLFKGNGFIYKGNLFFSGGIIGLANPSQLRYRQGDIWSSVPIDLTFDFGIHLDTKIGIFRLSIANLMGRLPLY